MNKFNKQDMRLEVSHILVKWGMSTRQVAIIEIVNLLDRPIVELTKDFEELHQHVAGALAWSDKHDKDEMLSAILNHITEINEKYGFMKSVPIKKGDYGKQKSKGKEKKSKNPRP